MKTFSLKRRYGAALLAAFLICALAPGCGKPKGVVFGKVIYGGKPLTTGSVTFTPEQGASVHSTIDSEGKYRVEKVPVGRVKISVRVDTGNPEGQNQAPPRPRTPGDMAKFLAPQSGAPKIPPRFNDPNKSGLTYDVEPGAHEHDIELK
jgi:hypothetical protein